MRRTVGVIALMLAVLSLAAWGESNDQFTPVVVSPLLHKTQRVLGTDGQDHVVYELTLTNTSHVTATLKKIEILDARDPSVALDAYEGDTLLARLFRWENQRAETPQLNFDETRLFLIHLVLDPDVPMPHQLVHRIEVLGATGPGDPTPVLQTYTVAAVRVRSSIPAIGPPLAGNGWVAINGCCEATGVHRSTGLPINGQFYYAQRYAIDWMRLDDKGRLVHGDPADVHSYTSYGADIIAVADGTIVAMRDDLEDQVPPNLPDPKTITAQTLLGNHVIQDIGDGFFAFYAHLKQGSVTVAPGDAVRRGQVVGKLGNSGNTSAPHLHFHIMAGRSAIASNGLPYVIDGFTLAGQIPPDAFTGVEGTWNEFLFPQPSAVDHQFPLDMAIVNFTP